MMVRVKVICDEKNQDAFVTSATDDDLFISLHRISS